jgi:Protein of unknown function DUF2617
VPLHELAVTPTDVSDTGLRLTLNAPAPTPLAVLQLDHPDGGGALELGILGASHVVNVAHAGAGFSEQISCAAQASGTGLPAHARAPGYDLQSHTTTPDERQFRLLAERLRGRCATEPSWLGGSFPGDSAALTAIHAVSDGAGWRWETWHLYPKRPGGTVVHTESRWWP